MEKDRITYSIIETADKTFGIEAVKPFQLLVMQRAVEQEYSESVVDQLVILPTGTGKSLCFMIPALLARGITVIIYPLLALMNDQISKLRQTGIDCVCLRGGQTHGQRRILFEKLRQGCKIVVSTPETLEQGSVLSFLKSFRISFLICDEAHVISVWGKEFRPAYSRLKRIVEELEPHQVMAFTATAGDVILQDIKDCLFREEPLVVRGDADRDNIYYASYPVYSRLQGVSELLKHCEKPAIVFCRTRGDAERMCRRSMQRLRTVPMRFYHAGLSRNRREDIEKWFMDSKDGVLFATCGYGMGVDKPDIRTVIHHKLPETVEEYLQESGRAGRDRKSSQAWVIVTRREMDEVKNGKRDGLIAVFCNTECRREGLLKLLGQVKDECSGCDVCCRNAIDKALGESTAKRFIRLNPLRFSVTRAAAILCGSRNVQVVPDTLRTNIFFGALSFMEITDVEKMLERMDCLKKAENRKGETFLYYGESPVQRSAAFIFEIKNRVIKHLRNMPGLKVKNRF